MKPSTRLSYEQAVRDTVKRIAQNLDDALELSELAHSACLSPAPAPLTAS